MSCRIFEGHFNISTNNEPNQCDVIEYHILNDETRNLNYGNYEAYCDGDNDLCKRWFSVTRIDYNGA